MDNSARINYNNQIELSPITLYNQIHDTSLTEKKKFFSTRSGNRNKDKKTNCNCTSSKCLKNYCDCFKKNEICDETCGCTSCKNTISIKKLEKELDFCTCIKSKCEKSYCECYKRNKKCSHLCRCLACNNKLNNTKSSFEISEFEIDRISVYIYNSKIEISMGKIFNKKRNRSRSGSFLLSTKDQTKKRIKKTNNNFKKVNPEIKKRLWN
jgi:hypothetical protein